MFQNTLRRSFLAFALVLVLGASAASAALPAWSFDSDLGRAVGAFLFRGLLAKHGCDINPDGTPLCTPAPKLGCNINPDGTPSCPPAPKLGCDIDPLGSPRCTP
jgi:type 1 fimbria pilin